MEIRGKRPDPPALCHATIRAAVAAAHEREPSLPLFAGGKSFGGRMTSQAQAEIPLPHVCGLVFFGFPLHPAKRPSIDRGTHLVQVKIPMLFLQGTRDALAELPLIGPFVKRLGKLATLTLLENADHSFHVPARSGRTDGQVRNEMLESVTAWADSVIEGHHAS
jgi:predicted alpha/beta-hydrolase family hydrolase